jgi:hypothetical protein
LLLFVFLAFLLWRSVVYCPELKRTLAGGVPPLFVATFAARRRLPSISMRLTTSGLRPAPPQSRGNNCKISGVSSGRVAPAAGSGAMVYDISEILRHVGDQYACMMPSFFIRDSSVVGLISSCSAAPWTPRIRQLHRWSARTMWARSASSRVPSVGLTACV